jgi:hypothetical protein
MGDVGEVGALLRYRIEIDSGANGRVPSPQVVLSIGGLSVRRLTAWVLGSAVIASSLLVPAANAQVEGARTKFSSAISFPEGSCSVLWANDQTQCTIQVTASKGRKVQYSLLYRLAGTSKYTLRERAKTSGSTARFELDVMNDNPEQATYGSWTDATYDYMVVVTALADKRRGLPAVKRTHNFTVEWRGWDQSLPPKDESVIVKRVAESLVAISCDNGPIGTAVSVNDYNTYTTNSGYKFSGAYVLAPVFDEPVDECDDRGEDLRVWYDDYESWGDIWRRGYKDLDRPTEMAGIVAFDQSVPMLDPTTAVDPTTGDWIAAVYLTDTQGTVAMSKGSVLADSWAGTFFKVSFDVTPEMSGAAIINNLGELVGFVSYDASSVERLDVNGQSVGMNWNPDTYHACRYVARSICSYLDPVTW